MTGRLLDRNASQGAAGLIPANMHRISTSGVDRRVADLAERVAEECLWPRAAAYDESVSYPVESWGDLWRHGLLAAAAPEAYGGLGLDMPTYTAVIERLAYGCTNTAMTMHMHSVVMRFIDALATPRQKERFYAEVVDGGKVFGSWGSEPGRRGGSGAARGTIVAPADGGYVINGVKHFCSMAGAAHRNMVHCDVEGSRDGAGLQLVIVPSGAAGMEISGEWNVLGMRATVSPTVTFRDCRVSEDDLLGKPGKAPEKGVTEGFGLGYAAVYLGAAQRAFDHTVEFCKTNTVHPDPAPLSHSVVVQRSVAEMAMALEGARLVLYESAGRWGYAGPGERRVLAARAKYAASRASLDVTSQCIQTVGGRGALRQMPLERIYRDVRTATLMPPNVDVSMELVGRAELDVR